MIPSLLQIPSAVSDSKLHSVLPNNGKGDFQFDRSTGATRINKDGLIEEVGYFSSELVQNGNFSELGSELIVNGDFATDSDWTKQTGWSINDGKAISNGSNAYLIQSSIVSSSPNKTFKVTFTVSNYVSGSFNVGIGGYDFYTPSTFANGEYTIYATAVNASSNNKFYFRGFNLYASIDNISVKQVDPNNRWDVVTGWSYGSNKITGSATQTEVTQDIDLPSGKVYKVTFTIEDHVSGQVRIRFRGGTTVNGTPHSGNGTYTEILTSTGHTNIKIDGTSAFTGSVTNISVVEVQGDRPRLSYDITNGVVEKQTHLLLEPSATNLITFSINYSQSDWIKSKSGSNSSLPTVTDDYATSPDGSVNASRIQFNCGSTSSSDYAHIHQNIALDGSSSYTLSFYIKSNTSANQSLLFFTQSAFGESITATTDWQRVETTFTSNSTNARNFGILARGSVQQDVDILIYGGQLEQQSFATSYIPTAGTTITRAAETCNNSKPSVNSTEGVLYVEAKALVDGGTNREITLTSGASTNIIRLRYSSNTSRFEAFMRSGGGTIQSLSRTAKPQDVFRKIALEYNSTEFAMWIDGTKEATVTTTSTPVGLNKLEFELNGASFFYGKVKGLAVYNEALTDAQLIELTS